MAPTGDPSSPVEQSPKHFLLPFILVTSLFFLWGDASNPRVQEWEKLMWKYQQALPHARQGEKWMLMNKIFDFKATV